MSPSKTSECLDLRSAVLRCLIVARADASSPAPVGLGLRCGKGSPSLSGAPNRLPKNFHIRLLAEEMLGATFFSIAAAVGGPNEGPGGPSAREALTRKVILEHYFTKLK